MSYLEAVREQARKQIEKLYEDTCTVYEKKKVTDPITKLTKTEDVEVLKNQPCKLSFSSVKAAGENSNVTTLSQVVKLFISSNVSIRPGSKIAVTRNGKTTEYASSGQEANFHTHKEIVLNLYEEYA